MRKVWENIKQFCFIMWFIWIIMSPLFVMKAILILSKYLSTYICFSIVTLLWAAILVLGAVLCVKPWRRKKKTRAKAA